MKKVYEYQSMDGPIFYSSAKKAYDKAKECEPKECPPYNTYLNRLNNSGECDINNDHTAIVIRIVY
jgi:hypothetical protein